MSLIAMLQSLKFQAFFNLCIDILEQLLYALQYVLVVRIIHINTVRRCLMIKIDLDFQRKLCG